MGYLLKAVVPHTGKVIEMRGLSAGESDIGNPPAGSIVLVSKAAKSINAVRQPAKGIAGPAFDHAIDGAVGGSSQFVIEIGYALIRPGPIHRG